MKTDPIEDFKKALADKPCPTAGTGCHVWLFWAACTAVEMSLDDDTAAHLIEQRMSRLPAPPTEIEDALRSARREERDPSQKWPARNIKFVHKILAEPEETLEPTTETAQDALELLFPGNPLLCIGQTSSCFSTRRRTEWAPRLGKCSLVVPSPMSAQQGRTKAGHMSDHSLSNTGPRHYLIVEFDWGLIQGQLKLLRHLATHGRMVQVVHSGSKSAHGWFDVRGQTEAQNFKFINYAVSLGADPRLWLRSQFCRLPGGTRDDGRQQKILWIAADFLRDSRDKSLLIPSDWKPTDGKA